MISKDELIKVTESMNLAEDMDEKELDDIGRTIVQWLDIDEEARRPWLEKNAQWLELACQVQGQKTYPWPNAANVKFPLLTTAAMQFAARSYPALVPGPNLVQGLVIGKDDGNMKTDSALRVGRHMSYQVLYEMEDWEEDMDRLTMIIPIAGCVFKKTYRDTTKDKNVSELVFAQDLIIDYFARSLETASRKSHLIYKTKNDVVERVNAGLWLDQPLGEPRVGEFGVNSTVQNAKDQVNKTHEPQVTDATPYKFVECHCFWDLDGDGYKEPYVITVHYNSRKVVRIVARFDIDGIITKVDESTGEEKLVKIVPIEYFTKFGFIPNPDGSIYDLGFGLLLGGINESVNTITNQLLDSGTLNNLQSGYLGRGIRIRSGGNRFSPGEWKPVDFVGDDIRKHIFPLPTKEPSQVLFKLLETLVTSGKELASVSEIFVGKMPGQNTPATTTMATIEQGLKVFTAIHKRLYRALGKEYQKLFRLNSIYMDEKAYFTINEPQGQVGQEVYKQDYSPENITVRPNADPNIVSQSQKLMKVQSYGTLLQLGTINPQVYTKRYLEAVEAENIAELMQVDQQQPDPEAQKMQAEMMMKQQESQMKMQLEQMKLQMKAQEMQFKEKEMQMELQFKMVEQQLKQRGIEIDMYAQSAKVEQDVTANALKHEQKLQQQEEAHKKKQQQSTKE